MSSRLPALLATVLLLSSACGSTTPAADAGADTRPEDSVGAPDSPAVDAGGEDTQGGGSDASSDAPLDAPGADTADAADVADQGGADLTGDAPSGQRIMFQGSATGPDPDSDAEVGCHFFGELVNLEKTDTGWSALAQGEAYRTITRDGLPLEFQAFVGGPATITLLEDDGVELRWVGDQTGAKPFWKELEVLPGSGPALDYEGTFRCAPIAPEQEGGFQDVPAVVDGTWTLGSDS